MQYRLVEELILAVRGACGSGEQRAGAALSCLQVDPLRAAARVHSPSCPWQQRERMGEKGKLNANLLPLLALHTCFRNYLFQYKSWGFFAPFY